MSNHQPRQLLRDLRRSTSGVAMLEFALSLPLLLTAGLWGTETANLAVTQMQVNQLANQVADNASRIGDTSQLQNRKIYESDVNDLLYGADVQGGTRMGIFQHGRVIISSLEVNAGGKQYIHWQRCKGAKVYNSSYGAEGAGSSGSGITGMGPAGEEVSAPTGGAVIFVEIAYDYQPLIGLTFSQNRKITSIASFMVRDSRDLSQIYQRDPLKPSTIAKCNVYDATPLV